MDTEIHTTNYFNTLIDPAEDCPVTHIKIPPETEILSVARRQYELLAPNPYKFTSDEILFEVYIRRNNIAKSEQQAARELFFSKGQACFRASPLTKRYGWSVHFDANGKMALVDPQSELYRQIKADKTIKVVKAMRSKRK